MSLSKELSETLISYLMDDLEKTRKEKNNAYAERNKLVSLISKVFPSSLGKHEANDPSWDKEWTNIVYVKLPTGQCSWHIHDSELHLFSHLKLDTLIKWDGHSTEEKYKRIQNYEVKNNYKYKQEEYDLESFDRSNCRFTC